MSIKGCRCYLQWVNKHPCAWEGESKINFAYKCIITHVFLLIQIGTTAHMCWATLCIWIYKLVCAECECERQKCVCVGVCVAVTVCGCYSACLSQKARRELVMRQPSIITLCVFLHEPFLFPPSALLFLLAVLHLPEHVLICMCTL